VLAEQPAPTRAFLLYTSVPDRIWANLADALVGDGHGRAQLQDLKRTNSFLTRHGPDQNW
jgi:LuxR family maltose regulon positive regulatory protein